MMAFATITRPSLSTRPSMPRTHGPPRLVFRIAWHLISLIISPSLGLRVVKLSKTCNHLIITSSLWHQPLQRHHLHHFAAPSTHLSLSCSSPTRAPASKKGSRNNSSHCSSNGSTPGNTSDPARSRADGGEMAAPITPSRADSSAG